MIKPIYADNVSGGEGCIFLTSVLPYVVKYSDSWSKFKFHFYWVTIYVDLLLWKEYINSDLFKKETDRILSYLHKDKKARYFKNLSKLILKQSNVLNKLSLNLQEKMSSATNNELKRFYNDFMKKYLKIYSLGAVTFIYESIISNILNKSLAQNCTSTQVSNIIGHLIKTNFKSFMIESDELLKKIDKIKNKNLRKKFMDKFIKEFYFIKTNYNASKILNYGDISRMLKDLKNEPKIRPPYLKINKVNLAEKDKLIVALMKPTMMIRDIRKKINLIGSYTMLRFLEEVSKRTNVEKRILKNAFWFELMDIFDNASLKDKWKKRKYASFIYDEGKIIYSGKLLIKDKKISLANVLNGIPASVGVSKGIVNIINGPKDFRKFKQGNILVTFATRPDFVSIMKKAAAILTQEGGLTSHAAIVSREFKIPCIVGISRLLDFLKDGDFVEVDAKEGIVKILKRK